MNHHPTPCGAPLARLWPKRVCAIGALTLAPLSAHAASLSAFAGTIAGYSGDIAGGCTTYGPPADLSFFSGSAAGLQVRGGNSACGFAGGWSTQTATGPSAPLSNHATLAPTKLSTSPTAKFFEATVDARAAYGSLSARAQGHVSGPVVSYYDNAEASAVGAATFSDTLTAVVPKAYTDVSTRGFVRYQFTIDGHASSPGPRSAFLNGSTLTNFSIQHDNGPTYGLLNASTRTDNLGDLRGAAAASGWTASDGSFSGGNTVLSGLFAIDLGKAWDFKAGLIVNVWGEADNDFYSTAKLVDIALFDSQGKPIVGYQITSASGVNYLAASVPEPETGALLGAGMLSLLALARTRRQGQARPSMAHEGAPH